MKGDAKLFEACASISKGALSEVEELLAPKLLFFKFPPQADVNARDTFGRTPLYIAVENGRRDIVPLLIEYGADINALKPDGSTALHAAVQIRHKYIVEILIAKGADVNIKAQDGSTAFSILASTVEEDIGHRGPGGSLDPEEVPIRHALAMDNCEDILKLLFKARVTIAPEDPVFFALIVFAIREKRVEVVKLLVDYGADLKARDKYGSTILHIAAREGTGEIVEFLLSCGAETNATNQFGETPLNLAFNAHNKETTDLLRKHGGSQ